MTIVKISGNWENKRISVNGTIIENKHEGLDFSWGDYKNNSFITAYYILYAATGNKRRLTEKRKKSFHRKIIANLPKSDFNMAVDITDFI